MFKNENYDELVEFYQNEYDAGYDGSDFHSVDDDWSFLTEPSFGGWSGDYDDSDDTWG